MVWIGEFGFVHRKKFFKKYFKKNLGSWSKSDVMVLLRQVPEKKEGGAKKIENLRKNQTFFCFLLDKQVIIQSFQ